MNCVSNINIMSDNELADYDLPLEVDVESSDEPDLSVSDQEDDSFEMDDESSDGELDLEISAYIQARNSFDLLGKLDENCSKVLVIPDNERTTSERIQLYEMVEAIGIRAITQLPIVIPPPAFDVAISR